MDDLYPAMVLGLLVLAGSMIAVELGLSVAIVELVLGVVAGNVLGIHPQPWLDFLAAFAGIVLTFLAGAEVDTDVLRTKFKESVLIGGASFLVPFALTWPFAQFALGWDLRAAQLAGVALSDTSLAVVYAVLVETGLAGSGTGRLLMASMFVTGFGVAAALALLFLHPTPWLAAFIAVSAAAIWVMPRVQPWFFARYGNRVIEPEIKGAFAALLVLMYFGTLAESHAVLPAFLLGLAVARVFRRHRLEQQRFRVVAFAFLTPFFFLKGGMSISLTAVAANFGLVAVLLAMKFLTKLAGVYPLARRYAPGDAWYRTLMRSTRLTCGTLATLFGLNAGIIDQEQFSVLVAVIVLMAIIPTVIAQRWFTPRGPA
ncbi:MAG: cation:proton antiporter [Chloroflexi bacterium]|nr:cation:proton antiporter [Chloroflexota bacterium]